MPSGRQRPAPASRSRPHHLGNRPSPEDRSRPGDRFPSSRQAPGSRPGTTPERGRRPSGWLVIPITKSLGNAWKHRGNGRGAPDGICDRLKSCYRLNSPVAGASPVASDWVFPCPAGTWTLPPRIRAPTRTSGPGAGGRLGYGPPAPAPDNAPPRPRPLKRPLGSGVPIPGNSLATFRAHPRDALSPYRARHPALPSAPAHAGRPSLRPRPPPARRSPRPAAVRGRARPRSRRPPAANPRHGPASARPAFGVARTARVPPAPRLPPVPFPSRSPPRVQEDDRGGSEHQARNRPFRQRPREPSRKPGKRCRNRRDPPPRAPQYVSRPPSGAVHPACTSASTSVPIRGSQGAVSPVPTVGGRTQRSCPALLLEGGSAM